MDSKLILIILLLINPVSAKFICGEVTPLDKLTPAWYDAKAYLSSNEFHSTTCKVSPSNNRYCCDIDSIADKTGYLWKAEDKFSIKITDTSSGYFASPKNLTLTGQGYDIAPKLELEKAIKLIYPNSSLIISENSSEIKINFSDHCTNQTIQNKNYTFGKNIIEANTICNEEIFSLNFPFFLVQNKTFQKQYLNFKSKNNPKIKAGEIGQIKIQLNLSHEINSLNLKEYIPISFEVLNISNNGTLQESTLEYNVILWETTGKNFEFNYKLKAPENNFVEFFNFKTMIGETTLDESTVQVYKIIPSPIAPRKNSGGGGYVYNPSSLSKVSPTQPLYFKDEDITAVLYSNSPEDQGGFNLLDFIYDGELEGNWDYIKSYKVQSTLNSSQKKKMIFEYELNDSVVEDYEEIGFFEKNADKFLKMTGAVISSENGKIKYRIESDNSPNEIFILGEREKVSFWFKIKNFFRGLRFW